MNDMKKQDIKLLLSFTYYLFTIMMIVVAYAAAYDPGVSPVLSMGLISEPKAIYLATWLIMMKWAWLEGKYDARKIMKGMRILHGWSLFARILGLILLLFAYHAPVIIGWRSTALAALLIGGGFSFIFNIKLLKTRNFPFDYFPITPGPYDSIYTIFPIHRRGSIKLVFEMIAWLSSIIYIFFL